MILHLLWSDEILNRRYCILHLFSKVIDNFDAVIIVLNPVIE